MTSFNPFLIIAVDGGAASGKSSTARRLAADFDLLHVDTGSHYRSITALLLQRSVPLDDPAAIARAVGELRPGTTVSGNSAKILLNDVGFDDSDLRSEAVNDAVSKIASIGTVRTFLRDYQRSQTAVAKDHNFKGLVMEGRDIGSVIFPNADLAVFLEADAATRVSRRADEGIIDTIEERDRLDLARKDAPLACPPNATRIDTGKNDLESVVAILSKKIQALGRANHDT
jgi:cytidylate kinase